jgi:hypothetical protein
MPSCSRGVSSRDGIEVLQSASGSLISPVAASALSPGASLIPGARATLLLAHRFSMCLKKFLAHRLPTRQKGFRAGCSPPCTRTGTRPRYSLITYMRANGDYDEPEPVPLRLGENQPDTGKLQPGALDLGSGGYRVPNFEERLAMALRPRQEAEDARIRVAFKQIETEKAQ